MKIHLYQKRIRGGRRRSPVQHRPRLSWHGRNLDGSRVRSMASIPLLSLSLSLFDHQPIAYPSSLVGSIDQTASNTSDSFLSRALQIALRNLEALQSPDARQRPSLTGKTRGGTDRSPDVPTTSRTRRHNDHGRLTVSCAPLARCATHPDAHRACKAALVVQCLPRCAIPPRRRCIRGTRSWAVAGVEPLGAVPGVLAQWLAST